MNIYKIIPNGAISRFPFEGEMVECHFDEAVVSLKTDVLDTNDPEQFRSYQRGLQTLIEKAKQEGEIRDFRMIREDNLFPYDWKWRVNSKETYREYAASNLAYYLRMAEAKSRVPVDDRFSHLPFEVPHDEEKEKQEALKIAPLYGRVYEPVKFRSTKHFTINTPLCYTGDYNQVSSDRLFTIIDTVDAFCDSGYGYSADYQDAYLDVTHEEIPISKNAIVLIREENYPKLMEDEEIKKQLQERRVILYRGNEGVAINMVLVQEGVLPYRFQGKGYHYDLDIENMYVESMKQFCRENGLLYSQNHGNLFGKGGHFTDLLDSAYSDRGAFDKEFSSFMQARLPEYAGLLNDTFYHYSYRMLPAIGHKKVVDAIQDYNRWAKEDEKEKRRQYDIDREQITPEIHTLFVQTLKMIQEFFEKGKTLTPAFKDLFTTFFHGSVSEQVLAAEEIQSLLKESEKQY